MKRQMLREFIREALLEFRLGNDDAAQGASQPEEESTLDWKALIEKSGIEVDDYANAVKAFMQSNNAAISEAADYYQNMGPTGLSKSDEAVGSLKELMNNAIDIDLEYIKGDKVLPLTLITLCATIDDSWDNLMQLITQTGLMSALKGPVFEEFKKSSSNISEAAPAVAAVGTVPFAAALGSAIFAAFAIIAATYAISGGIDWVMNIVGIGPWLSQKYGSNFVTLWKNVYNKCYVPIQRLGNYFKKANVPKVGDQLIALADLLNSEEPAPTRSALVSLQKTLRAP